MNYLANIIAKYALDIPTKLLDWISNNDIEWEFLSLNPSAEYLIEKNIDKIIIMNSNPAMVYYLENHPEDINRNISENINALHLIEQYPDKIQWTLLSRNPAAIHLLEKNPNKIDWGYLSRNPAAIHLLEKNLDKIDWDYLSRNPSAIHLLEKNPDKINWGWLSENTAPAAIELLENNQDKIDWNYICHNPAAIHLLEKNIDKINWDYLASNSNAIHMLQKYESKKFGRGIWLNRSIIEFDQYNYKSMVNKFIKVLN
jgi:hypothetical protein